MTISGLSDFRDSIIFSFIISHFRLLWSMRNVTANLFGVARSSANSAREENSITPATEINMLSVNK